MKSRWFVLFFIVGIFLGGLLTPLAAQETDLLEAFQIKITNDKSGFVEISVDQGMTWKTIGTVLHPVTQINKWGFHRSIQAPDHTVCETAVDRIQLKTGVNYDDSEAKYGRGSLIGIAANERYFLDKKDRLDKSLIYTDIPAGELIFGQYAPLLGNRFYVEKMGNLYLTGEEFEPQKGDVFIIVVETDPVMINEIVFENRFGGSITAHYNKKDPEVIGTVLRPVDGIGEFIGTEYCQPGEVRQTHGNVIGISTSAKASGRVTGIEKFRGGFQIITNQHVYDHGLIAARLSPQWMVVGPPPGQEFIDLHPPLFSGFIYPTMKVECRIDDGDWEPFPEISGSREDALTPPVLATYYAKYNRRIYRGITHIRLVNTGF